MFEEYCQQWKRLRVPQVKVGLVGRGRAGSSSRARAGGGFLRGPIPLSWLGPACRLPGRHVLVVALAVWLQAGLRKRRDRLDLPMDALRRLDVDCRMAKSRGLKALEQAGLIAVENRPGRDPLVSLLADQDFSGEAGQQWVAGKFPKGPIPLAWLCRVARLPGQKVLAFALAVRFCSGLNGRKDGLKLTSAVLSRFGVEDRSAKTRALRALEDVGLIRVERHPGRNPLVTIVEVPGAGASGDLAA